MRNLFGPDLQQKIEAHAAPFALLLIDPHLRGSHRQIADSPDDAHAFRDRNRAARVEQVKQVRALQHLVIRRQHREAPLLGILLVLAEQLFALGFVFGQKAPEALDVGHLEVVDGELQLVGQAHFGVLHARRPFDVIHAIDVLQERDNALQAVGDFGRNQVQIDAAALLEIGELRDLQPIQHHLPADAPRAQRGRFPVVFLELDVVLGKIDADGLRLPRY